MVSTGWGGSMGAIEGHVTHTHACVTQVTYGIIMTSSHKTHASRACVSPLHTSPTDTSVWKAFFFTPDFGPRSDANGCFRAHVCPCTGAGITRHDPPLLFDVTRDPGERRPVSPREEPRFHAIVAAMRDATARHLRSLPPIVPDQLSVANLVWKPWLQL